MDFLFTLTQKRRFCYCSLLDNTASNWVKWKRLDQLCTYLCKFPAYLGWTKCFGPTLTRLMAIIASKIKVEVSKSMLINKFWIGLQVVPKICFRFLNSKKLYFLKSDLTLSVQCLYNSKDMNFYFKHGHFGGKDFLILSPSIEFGITHITIIRGPKINNMASKVLKKIGLWSQSLSIFHLQNDSTLKFFKKSHSLHF